MLQRKVLVGEPAPTQYKALSAQFLPTKASMETQTTRQLLRPTVQTDMQNNRNKSVITINGLHLTDQDTETVDLGKGLRMCYIGTGEVAQWLGVLTALPEDTGSIPSTHMEAHNCLLLQFQAT